MFGMSVRGVLLAACLVGVASCGSGGPDLSPLAAEGQEIARESGCAACHGSNGQGGVGPAWTSLFGSEVSLEDGTVVVADDAYLRTSIRDPQADIVAGYTTKMPENTLDDAQIDAVIAYIRELGS